jgi:hypothetical protein
MDYMARDIWQTLRKAPLVGRLNKYVTIPAFSVECGPTRGCLYAAHETWDVIELPIGSQYDSFAVEFWIKPQATVDGPATADYLSSFVTLTYALSGDTYTLELRCAPSVSQVVTSINGVEAIDMTTPNIGHNVWSHVAIVNDAGSDNEIRLYVNGVLADTKATATGGIGVGELAITIGDVGICRVADVRVWNNAISYDEILYRMDKYTSHANMLYHFRFNEDFDDTTATYTGTTTDASLVYIDDESYPPIGFGASFIAAEFQCALSYPTSFKYPVEKPTTDCNFCLCVRWEDEDGSIQRRKFWTVGEDIAPDPAEYAGERLPVDCVLEVWNIDGNDTVDLATALSLDIGLTVKATSGEDFTQTAEQTLTKDSALYVTFPTADDTLTPSAEPSY